MEQGLAGRDRAREWGVALIRPAKAVVAAAAEAEKAEAREPAAGMAEDRMPATVDGATKDSRKGCRK